MPIPQLKLLWRKLLLDISTLRYIFFHRAKVTKLGSRKSLQRSTNSKIYTSNVNQCWLCGGQNNEPIPLSKCDLRSITAYRNGHSIAGTLLETDTDKKMYLNSMGALAFDEHGHGFSFEEYANHYLLVSDLTSTHQASHDYLLPELTNASISISLRFDTALSQIIKVLLLGECASTIYNNSKKVSKKDYIASDTALTRKWLTNYT